MNGHGQPEVRHHLIQEADLLPGGFEQVDLDVRPNDGDDDTGEPAARSDIQEPQRTIR